MFCHSFCQTWLSSTTPHFPCNTFMHWAYRGAHFSTMLLLFFRNCVSNTVATSVITVPAPPRAVTNCSSRRLWRRRRRRWHGTTRASERALHLHLMSSETPDGNQHRMSRKFPFGFITHPCHLIHALISASDLSAAILTHMSHTAFGVPLTLATYGGVICGWSLVHSRAL